MNDSIKTRFAKLLGISVFLGLGVVTSFPATAGQKLTLGWDASPAAAAGYRVYWSADGVNYNQQQDAGTNTQATIPSLQEGATYYFYVSSYDTNKVESQPSQPISYIVPGITAVSAKPTPRTPAKLSFPVAPGHAYKVQASVDLKNWVTIWQTNAVANEWIQYSDPLGATLKMRFYRTVAN